MAKYFRIKHKLSLSNQADYILEILKNIGNTKQYVPPSNMSGISGVISQKCHLLDPEVRQKQFCPLWIYFLNN